MKYFLGKYIDGAPAFIVEILSSNVMNDKIRKKNLYEKYGVEEYWIVDPNQKEIEKYLLVDNKYQDPVNYSINDTITCTILDLDIACSQIFDV